MDQVEKRAVNNFLEYAGAVIKARAISDVNDNLKPVHKRILWTMWNRKLYDDAHAQKCATVAGAVLAYHPHGDTAVYGALVRLAQSWKTRYPLITFEGNVGNIIGADAAASRYTNCKLSKVGTWMLEGIDKNAVPMVDNYDNTLKEPTVLPSVFPNILCNGSVGIAVGISASLVPFNYNETANFLEALMDNPDMGTEDILKIMPGPDFPTYGLITNGEILKDIYTTGRGNLIVRSHYKLGKNTGRDEIIFTDLPYGVEIADGVIAPLKKLVNEEGIDLFYDILNNTSSNDNVEIHIILNKGVSIESALAVLFDKTKLQQTVKVNNMVLVNGEPNQLSIKSMAQEWLKHRHSCIINIAKTDLAKANNHLTILIGLEKCMSDIDNVVKLIRAADSRADAKQQLMSKYELVDIQADAILDMKLSRLSRLDVRDIKDDDTKTRAEISKQEGIIKDSATRNTIIKEQLELMRKTCGDKRRTEINYAADKKTDIANIRPHEFFGYTDRISDILPPTYGANNCCIASAVTQLFAYSKDGTIYSGILPGSDCIAIGNLGGDYLVTVTKKGYIKKTLMTDIWKTKIKSTKVLKLKEDDELILAATANDNDYILILGTNGALSKIAISELNAATKLTLGSLLGIGEVACAIKVSENDTIAMVDTENKGKLVAAQDYNTNVRTSKGQKINDNVKYLINVVNRQYLYAVAKTKIYPIEIEKKMTLKSKTASGASIINRNIERLF